jgi:predicted DNA-binding protein YlxM (UPF0122 family)
MNLYRRSGEFMERNIELGYLLDFYGEFLTGHQAAILDLHVNEDLSLAEIAEREGISRQGVHDSLKRAEQRLTELEAKMKLLERTKQTLDGLKRLKDRIAALTPGDLTEQEKARIFEELDRLADIWEEGHGV